MRFFTLFAILAAVVGPAACHANETEFEIESTQGGDATLVDNWAMFNIQNCQRGRKAPKERIRQGMEYLDASPNERVEIRKGCKEVSCTYNSAIWMCGLSNEVVSVSSYKVIAIGVSKIMTECGKKGRISKKTSGEAHQKSWYVQIGHSGRHC
ncbi:uncharacterized protein PG986_004456 [Apiospora aurea]|uniref:Uncharacterized protein n=1 Tax=Apiospora aurea TaxID=335848 RepID=A0ABR1QMN9_9PEZI